MRQQNPEAGVKATSISLDEEQARALRELSAEEGRSLTDVVREALDEYLARRRGHSLPRAIGPPQDVPEEEWRARFDAALEKIRSHVPPDMESAEIEAEITAASAEVRRERAAGRRDAGG
jgi:hypothetical protein